MKYYRCDACGRVVESNNVLDLWSPYQPHLKYYLCPMCVGTVKTMHIESSMESCMDIKTK